MTPVNHYRPEADKVRPLTYTKFKHRFGYDAPLTWRAMEHLGLGLFTEIADKRSAWIGFKDATMHSHDRWLFRTHHAEASGEFMACGREIPKEHDWYDSDDRVDIKIALTAMRLQAADVNNMLKIQGAPTRDIAWILMHYQIFGHLDATLIKLLPTEINWVQLHGVIHHYDAWCQASDAMEMPHDLALRMHGLGPVIDHRRNGLFYNGDI